MSGRSSDHFIPYPDGVGCNLNHYHSVANLKLHIADVKKLTGDEANLQQFSLLINSVQTREKSHEPSTRLYEALNDTQVTMSRNGATGPSSIDPDPKNDKDIFIEIYFDSHLSDQIGSAVGLQKDSTVEGYVEGVSTADMYPYRAKSASLSGIPVTTGGRARTDADRSAYTGDSEIPERKVGSLYFHPMP